MEKIIDTRDLQKRLDELESELESLNKYIMEAQADELSDALIDAKRDLEEWQEEYQEELAELRELASEIGEFCYGETLIHEDYFEEYAQDLASDLYGNELNSAYWPFDCIDWEQAADALKMDYSSIEYQGETYFCRS